MSTRHFSIMILFLILLNLSSEFDYKSESLRLHSNKKGKIEISSKVPINTKDDLNVVYNPGVLAPVKKI